MKVSHYRNMFKKTITPDPQESNTSKKYHSQPVTQEIS